MLGGVGWAGVGMDRVGQGTFIVGRVGYDRLS